MNTNKPSKYDSNESNREQFFADLDDAYRDLQEKPDEWQAYQEELVEWDVTLMDGLNDL